MEVKIHPSWKQHLAEEFSKEYFKNLTAFVKQQYRIHTCYPKETAIFAAFNACALEAVKVVIIGQDPYHGAGQANGFCFSVPKGISHPPSLTNIFKELQADIGMAYPKSGDLSAWAKQGVLLLNATLTVRAQEAGSHQKQGWETFTDAVISILSKQKDGIAFLLWGGYAKKKGAKIDTNKHLVLTSGHPSPLSANRGYWFGNKHFSAVNAYLKSKNSKEIDWTIV